MTQWRYASKIAKISQQLNEIDHVTVQTEIQGQTGCIVVIVKEHNLQIYEDKAFLHERGKKHLKQLIKDLKKMLSYAKRRCKD